MGDAFSTGESGDLSKRLVGAVRSDFPCAEPGTRPVHAKGIGVTGCFRPSDVAPNYSTAEQFHGGDVPVTVRFSNGSGCIQNDSEVDARGMATKFHLASGRETDLVMMTLPTFFVQTPDQFLDFAAAAQPRPVQRVSFLRELLDLLAMRMPTPGPDPGKSTSAAPGTIDYASRHPCAAFSVITLATQQPPTSYVRANYHAVHTFRATGADGVVRFVRLAWEPVAGVRPIDPDDAGYLEPDYLHTELRKRLPSKPGRFTLRMQIAGQGDVIDDPTAIWDDSQARVTMGELVLTKVTPDQDAGCEHLSFNPCRVVPGLSLSDDPILLVRRGAYEDSCRQRKGTGCPA